MKRVFCAVLALLAVMTAAAGCAEQKPAETDDVTTAATETETETAEFLTEETTETVTETEAPPRFELDYTKPLTAEGVRILTFKCPEKDYVTAQGCCFDGENWVVAFNKFDKNGEGSML